MFVCDRRHFLFSIEATKPTKFSVCHIVNTLISLTHCCNYCLSHKLFASSLASIGFASNWHIRIGEVLLTNSLYNILNNISILFYVACALIPLEQHNHIVLSIKRQMTFATNEYKWLHGEATLILLFKTIRGQHKSFKFLQYMAKI